MAFREVAWRVLARELESSLEEEKGEGDRPVGHVLSPFGARMNRVLVAGTLSPAEPVGRDDPPTFWRARLTDPSGAVPVTAGGFQPRAMAQLRAVTVPRPSIVVGKVHLYRGRDAVAYVSVRAEAIRAVAESDERAALAEIVRQTFDRLDLIERLEKEPAVPDETLRAAGSPRPWIRAARDALHRYPNVDRAAFRRELRACVRRVAGDSGPAASAPSPPPTVRVSRAPPPAPPPAAPTAAERADESLFLDLVDELSDHSVDGYADLKDVLEQIAQRGVHGERAEAVLNRLEEGGVLEEPVVGKLRRAD
jgi:RPA family protein